MANDDSWLIIDTKNGGIDGYYFHSTQAEIDRIVASWKNRLGHDDVVATIVVSEVKAPSIGNRCFLPSREANDDINNLRADWLDLPPPDCKLTQRAINTTTEILRDLYDRSVRISDIHSLARKLCGIIRQLDS